ncbi:MAG: L-aspartate oxidase [bacterium]|nr:MAG: L-aspartate oxidase [bacterium]
MHKETDFVVIGSGIAGLRAAIGLSQGKGQVIVLTKDRVSESNTEYAQGGVAVVLSDDDQVDLHLTDTLEAGAGLCDESAVRVLVEEGPKYITELINWGTSFDTQEGKLLFTKEAAHSRHRILHAHGDSTGREIVRGLLAHAQTIPQIAITPHAITLDLILEANQVVGVKYLDIESNELCYLYARSVVLATGGAGQIYAHTTNPEVATGDGMGMAYRAGARMCDMEFMQFHPTALNVDGAPNFLLSEAMRGEGGYLINSDGKRFMDKYDKREELAPRDIVSRAIVSEIRRNHSNQVYLDVTHLKSTYLRERFPKIFLTCLKYNYDITKDPIPVSPAAHYIMGGIRTDSFGRTSLVGLYAAGEVASTGVHGANRLASNSLLEGLVFGARAAEATLKDNLDKVKIKPKEIVDSISDNYQLDKNIRLQISEIMWRYVGIIRSANRLETAISQLAELAKQPLNLVSRNCLEVAQMIARAAHYREESRGGHYREDYPIRNDDEWHCHTIDQLRKDLSKERLD